ncbi:MAG TPA: NAD(P)H-dependent oxidoreductase subunit E [Candidatus Dormibacteraeota bacterium]|nr:NAD(P)H-dependent oxidoreductase subunit E [Candidatus Dormibacteraeota bacterium]
MSLDRRQLPTTGPQTGPTNPYHEGMEREGATVSEHVLDEIRELPKRFQPGSRSAVMPALDLVQEELGHLTPAAMAQVAEALEIDPGYVEGVATFYTLFHLQPVGEHHFYVCNNLSCQLGGAEEILTHLKDKIGVREYGEMSSDGRFSCEPVECLGACEYAPVMRYQHRFHYDLTPAKIDQLIEAARKPKPAPKSKEKPHG